MRESNFGGTKSPFRTCDQAQADMRDVCQRVNFSSADLFGRQENALKPKLKLTASAAAFSVRRHLIG